MEMPLSAPVQALPVTDKKKNRRLTFLLLLLLLFLGFLVYLYWLLTKPPTPAEVPKPEGITWLFSIYGHGKQRLNSPDGVAFGPEGKIYVSDTGNHRGMVFDRSGKYLFTFGERTAKKGIQKKKLFFPLGLDVDPDSGDIFVASMMASRINVYDKNGKYKREIVQDRPIRVKVYKKRLYIASPGSLWITTLKGKVIKRISSPGQNIGQVQMPNGIDFDKKGNIYVSDTENNRIQIFDKKGRVIGGRGEPTTTLNQSSRLFGLGVALVMDEKEMVYITDAFHHAIRVFDHDGNDYGEYGQQGSNDAQFNYPSDLAYEANGVFAVADKWNDRIQVIQLTHKPKPKSKFSHEANAKAKQAGGAGK